jgi:PBP1b-binding outer membrane lipoprotein LpoB
MKRFAVLLVIMLLFGGCAYQKEYSKSKDTAKKNSENLVRLKMGMSREELLQVMGAPEKTQANNFGGQPTEVLSFRIKADYFTNDDDSNFIQVVVRNGKVIGWGDSFFSQAFQ